MTFWKRTQKEYKPPIFWGCVYVDDSNDIEEVNRAKKEKLEYFLQSNNLIMLPNGKVRRRVSTDGTL